MRTRTLALLGCLALQAVEPEHARTLDDGRVLMRSARAAEAGEGARESCELRSAEGSVLAEGEFADGRLDGLWRFRDEKRRVRVKLRYRAGLRSGPLQIFDAAGKTLVEGAFADGAPSGTWSHRDEPSLCGTFEHVGGSGTSGTRFEGSTLNGLRHGRWNAWWPDGRVLLEARFAQGRPLGPWRVHHADGTLDPELYASLPAGEDVYESLLAEVDELERLLAPTPAAEPAPRTLAELPALLALEGWEPEDEDTLRATLRALEADALSTRAVSDALALLAARGEHARGALPAVLARLCALDLARPEDLAAGARYAPLFAAIGLGAAFDWRAEADARAHDRLTLLRLHTLWTSTRELPSFWTFELALLATIPAEAQPTLARELLLAPPWNALFPLGLDAATSELYAGRLASRRQAGGGQEGAAEHALRDALDWLVRHQSPDGRWDGDGFARQCERAGEGTCDGPGEALHDVGLSALALLALMGDGNAPQRGRHAQAVERGLVWLAGTQRPEDGCLIAYEPTTQGGGVYAHTFFVDHALATQALAEGCALADSKVLRAVATRATRYVESARNPYSGWRYSVPPRGESDTHVTGWALEALAAASEAGIEVDPRAFEGGLALLDELSDPATGRVGYMVPGGECARVEHVNDHFPQSQETLTAVGLVCRLLLGQRPSDDPLLEKHAQLILRKLPLWRPESFQCDMLGWMHGSYGLRALGEPYWSRWWKALEPMLLDAQRREGELTGSWDPVGAWGMIGGRVYSTAVLALALEAPFRALPRVEASSSAVPAKGSR